MRDFVSILARSIVLLSCLVVGTISGFKDWSKDRAPEKWNKEARVTLDELLVRGINKNIAKNVILFLGDGMGVSTVTGGRIRKGQMQGLSSTFN